MSEELEVIPAPDSVFDARRRAVFCERLSHAGNVRLACKVAGVSAQTAYRARRADADFRACWDAALVLARAAAEEELADRALNGVEEEVFYHGEVVAMRRRYDARLLLAHLARLDRLADKAEANLPPEDFDLALARLERGEAVARPARADRVAEDALAEAPWGPFPDYTGDGFVDGVPIVEAALQWLERKEREEGEEPDEGLDEDEDVVGADEPASDEAEGLEECPSGEDQPEPVVEPGPEPLRPIHRAPDPAELRWQEFVSGDLPPGQCSMCSIGECVEHGVGLALGTQTGQRPARPISLPAAPTPRCHDRR
ncbi:hypothetical protein [Alteraurantiacibacter aquimixticola]|uniref:Uncharacterized protein n=1 Tax=Alteraurantiacibacter aquimixticola TaxID=2489173 RepID=A0A4T3F0D1_9SPHN|nr:hypothetical protein [Alteraurantiacibacter aquimixticola]TIX50384.1 hypothetical protein E5222_08905 [Alteraurantiacibacter aquimixticola]